jgi:hypothetical protein
LISSLRNSNKISKELIILKSIHQWTKLLRSSTIGTKIYFPIFSYIYRYSRSWWFLKFLQLFHGFNLTDCPLFFQSLNFFLKQLPLSLLDWFHLLSENVILYLLFEYCWKWREMINRQFNMCFIQSYLSLYKQFIEKHNTLSGNCTLFMSINQLFLRRW